MVTHDPNGCASEHEHEVRPQSSTPTRTTYLQMRIKGRDINSTSQLTDGLGVLVLTCSEGQALGLCGPLFLSHSPDFPQGHLQKHREGEALFSTPFLLPMCSAGLLAPFKLFPPTHRLHLLPISSDQASLRLSTSCYTCLF